MVAYFALQLERARLDLCATLRLELEVPAESGKDCQGRKGEWWVEGIGREVENEFVVLKKEGTPGQRLGLEKKRRIVTELVIKIWNDK